MKRNHSNNGRTHGPSARHATQHAAPKHSAKADEREARTLGEFTVFFDSRVDDHGAHDWLVRIYDAASGDETLLEPPERDHWADWIMRRVKLPAAVRLTVTATPRLEAIASAARPIPKHKSTAPHGAEIEVLDVRLVEGTTEHQPSSEIRFKLSGDEAASLADRRTLYRVEFYAVDLKRREPALLAAKQGHLEPQVFEYTNQQAFALPDLGRYELHSLVMLLPPAERIASHRGPVINVVP